MKLKNFEDCLGRMGLELISVTMSSKGDSEVTTALAIEKLGKKKCVGYVWFFGACRKSLAELNYQDVRANVAFYNATGPLQWAPFPSLNFTELERKYFGEKKNNV